jgi:hypothetical protein
MMERQLALSLMQGLEDAVQHLAQVVNIMEPLCTDRLGDVTPNNTLQKHCCRNTPRPLSARNQL